MGVERIWYSKCISKKMIKILHLQYNQNLFSATNSVFENVQWSCLNRYCASAGSVCHHLKQNERNLETVAEVPHGGYLSFTVEGRTYMGFS